MSELVCDIGGRRELLADDYLLSRFEGGAALHLHRPTPREGVLVTDKPWEGCMSGYITVLRDGSRCRMYYRGLHVDLRSPDSRGESLRHPHPAYTCLAKSADGVHWQRPILLQYDFGGSVEAQNAVFDAIDIVAAGSDGKPLREYNFGGTRENNIVRMGKGCHAFSPFLDGNPKSPPEARYKAVTPAEGWPCPGLLALYSADGVRWSWMHDQPMITKGKFDSHNVAFWDGVRSEYRVYLRDELEGECRGIRTATSPDFANWTDPEWLEYPGAPIEDLYTNNVQPYYRAPHLFVGFPARYVGRVWSPSIEALPELEHRRLRAGVGERFGTALSDAVFMSSRNGRSFRRWGEAFIRPGLRDEGNWTYGDNFPAWGILETESDLPGGGKELSLYAGEGYWRGRGATIRRYTLRVDGFVSARAPLAGGEIVTRPLRFAGSRLSLNVSTSAAGGVRAEMQDAEGRPIPGYALEDCWEVVGDSLDYTVRWKQGTDVSTLRDRPIRLRFALRDADLYALQFVSC